jgi:hypothetical protein
LWIAGHCPTARYGFDNYKPCERLVHAEATHHLSECPEVVCLDVPLGDPGLADRPNSQACRIKGSLGLFERLPPCFIKISETSHAALSDALTTKRSFMSSIWCCIGDDLATVDTRPLWTCAFLREEDPIGEPFPSNNRLISSICTVLPRL